MHDLAERHGLRRREGGALRPDQIERLLDHGLDRQGRVVLRIVDETGVETGGLQPLGDLRAAAFRDADTRARIAIAERLHDPQDEAGAELRRHAEHDLAGRHVVVALQFGVCLVELPQDVGHAFVVTLALLGQDGAAAVAIEQCDAELLLELADVTAERRLCDAHRDGGAAEAPEVGNLQEISQLTEFHGRTVPSARASDA